MDFAGTMAFVRRNPSAILLSVQLLGVILYPFVDAPGGRALLGLFGLLVLLAPRLGREAQRVIDDRLFFGGRFGRFIDKVRPERRRLARRIRLLGGEHTRVAGASADVGIVGESHLVLRRLRRGLLRLFALGDHRPDQVIDVLRVAL